MPQPSFYEFVFIQPMFSGSRFSMNNSVILRNVSIDISASHVLGLFPFLGSMFQTLIPEISPDFLDKNSILKCAIELRKTRTSSLRLVHGLKYSEA